MACAGPILGTSIEKTSALLYSKISFASLSSELSRREAT